MKTKRNVVRRTMRTFGQNAVSAVLASAGGYMATGEWGMAAGAGLVAILSLMSTSLQNALENKSVTRKDAPVEED